jgi:hypothetical protein
MAIPDSLPSIRGDKQLIIDVGSKILNEIN